MISCKKGHTKTGKRHFIIIVAEGLAAHMILQRDIKPHGHRFTCHGCWAMCSVAAAPPCVTASLRAVWLPCVVELLSKASITNALLATRQSLL